MLHGYTGTGDDWVRDTSILSLASQFNLALVCPSGENSFYLDGTATGRKYETYVGRELVDHVRSTFGLSPPGRYVYRRNLHGRLRRDPHGTGLPETFSKIISLSAALITHKVAAMKPGAPDLDGMANYDYYRLMFGDPEKLLESRNNPETLVKDLMASGSS